MAQPRALDPPADQVLVVDGGSGDGTVAFARAAGLTVIEPVVHGRAVQINRGVAASQAAIVCIPPADTLLPDDAVAVMRRVLADRRTVLAGFTALLCGADTVRRGISFHNRIKTWYAPLLFRPHLFRRGTRLLFGDHALFFRRAQFLAVGGCDERLRVMEDADRCVRLGRIERVRLVNRVVLTSARRVARWGAWRTNWIHLSVGIRWGLGRRGIERHHPDVRQPGVGIASGVRPT